MEKMDDGKVDDGFVYMFYNEKLRMGLSLSRITIYMLEYLRVGGASLL